MYGKGDYISYSGHGVCQIADIRNMNFRNGEQEYLVIEPIASGSATIYLPSGNQKTQTRMRPVLTRKEIDAIISSVKNDQMPWTVDRKQRTFQFQQILSRRDTRELLLLASCLYKRNAERQPRGIQIPVYYVPVEAGGPGRHRSAPKVHH